MYLQQIGKLARLAPTLAAKKSILSKLPGIQFPDDFDTLPDSEKEKRLNAAILIALDKDEPTPGKPKEVYNTLDEIYQDASGHQVTGQELLNGRTKLFGSWQGITISQELREQICDRLSESYGGRERTKLAVYRKLISTPTPQHWSLERFLLVKYSDKPAKFSYCAGQDQQWENADARKFFTK